MQRKKIGRTPLASVHHFKMTVHVLDHSLLTTGAGERKQRGEEHVRPCKNEGTHQTLHGAVAVLALQ